MSFDREAIYSAMFNLVASDPAYVTKSRRLLHWNDVAPTDQPAIFMAQRNELCTPVRGMPPVWEFTGDFYIYCRTDGGLPPGPIINPLLDKITALLGSDGKIDNVQTLGGLVHYARIEGAIETDEGTLGDQTVAIVPFSIKVS